jgi:PAS domain S-box-containing protein
VATERGEGSVLASGAPSVAARRRVLIVEDESIAALDLRRTLEATGYEVAVVLMDIHLRGSVDGIEAARVIADRHHVPVVYLTAYGDEDTLRRARVTHPFGYLLKPFDERALRLALETALFRRDLERRLADNENWFQSTLASLGDGVIATNPTGHVRLMNAVAESLTGWKAADAIGEPLVRVLSGAALPGSGAGSPPGSAERVLRRADGEPVTVEQRTTWIVDDRERMLGTVTVLHDVTEQRRAAEALARQAAELARSNADLERFAYVASHDLQEPLRMVGSYVELLARRYRGRLDADADEFIAFASDGVARMRTLIDDLLAYARVGPAIPADSLARCDEALEQALANLRGTLEENRVTVERGTLPAVAGDVGRLVPLFQNLVGNAVKFRSERPPHVRLAAERQGEFWTISCADNGIGIAAEDVERVFGLFERLHSRAAYPGTGVGLAICKRIVERHGGRIWVESTPGEGSTFRFTLPAAKPSSG